MDLTSPCASTRTQNRKIEDKLPHILFVNYAYKDNIILETSKTKLINAQSISLKDS